MDTEKNYAVITYFIGNDIGNGVKVEVVEHLGKLLTCTICDTPMSAIKEFESQVNTLCWNKCLTDCMKSYYRGSDNVCRDIFLCKLQHGIGSTSGSKPVEQVLLDLLFLFAQS